jgi:uncharacterized membrane protein YgdD (TMEM256/DUF423 family)
VSTTQLRIFAASLGFIGVALGAFGAHALAERLAVYGKEQWQTATWYLFFHVATALALLADEKFNVRPAITLHLIGVCIFSGSLYALALTQVKILGAITPIGGVLFLSGWALIAFTAGSRNKRPN